MNRTYFREECDLTDCGEDLSVRLNCRLEIEWAKEKTSVTELRKGPPDLKKKHHNQLYLTCPTEPCKVNQVEKLQCYESSGI